MHVPWSNTQGKRKGSLTPQPILTMSIYAFYKAKHEWWYKSMEPRLKNHLLLIARGLNIGAYFGIGIYIYARASGKSWLIETEHEKKYGKNYDKMDYYELKAEYDKVMQSYEGELYNKKP